MISPCHIMPSSCSRPLVTSMTIPLYRTLSWVESISSARGRFVLASISSIQRIRGLPRPRLPSLILSIVDFSSPLALATWPKYESFCFLILFCSGMTGPISSHPDALVRNAFQGIRSILLQHHSSKASILLVSFFFMVHDSDHETMQSEI